MSDRHDRTPSEENRPEQDPTIELGDNARPIRVPKLIGSYRVKRLIASGGMGSVYEALQEQPRRSVAVKVMRAGRYSDSGLRRFAYEAQVLARLRHPGVAQIYEAGSYHEDGCEIPYFAMEYIPNAKPITSYVRDRQLGTRQILELFLEVCDAVHHGHQKGIVHRDLKPGNILVDSAGRPKIIDFGLARATDSDMAAAAEQTQAGQIVGTLQYMSPEQFELDPADVDTRSDIYALGVVLYELLAKRLPYDVHGSKLHEVPAIVNRSSPPGLGSVDASLRGDLATIVGCAMEKDRDRRYQSAHGLRSDIRRYLDGAAVSARPPTLGYQLQVLVRRHKIWIAAAAVAVVALISAAAFSTYMYFRASAERARAELHAARSRKAIDFVSEMMEEAAPKGWGHQPTIADLLQNTREKVDVVFADQPLVAAEIHRTLAWASLPQEDFESMENHCATALSLRRDHLGPSDPRTLESLQDLQRAQLIRGRNQELIATTEELVEASSRVYEPNAPEMLAERDGLALAYELEGRLDEALTVVLELIDRSVESVGGDDPLTVQLMTHASYLQLKMGRIEQACETAARAHEQSGVRLGEDDHAASEAKSALAACWIARGDLDAAAKLYDLTYPRDLGIEFAFQGPANVPGKGPELLVMWETWCPFSQRVVPIVEELYRRYQERGLAVAALTRVNRGSSDERVRLFIRNRGLTFPVLKDSGKAWSYFEATGTPYVILLSDGRVVWKSSVGSPAELSSGLVRALVESHAG